MNTIDNEYLIVFQLYATREKTSIASHHSRPYATMGNRASAPARSSTDQNDNRLSEITVDDDSRPRSWRTNRSSSSNNVVGPPNHQQQESPRSPTRARASRRNSRSGNVEDEGAYGAIDEYDDQGGQRAGEMSWYQMAKVTIRCGDEFPDSRCS